MEYTNDQVESIGGILKSLNPTSVAILLFTLDETVDTQTEMAERLDYTTAPVSISFKMLSELPLPLVENNREYQITAIGEATVNLIDKYLLELDIDLCDVDWSDESDKEEIDTALRPLHNSRSMIPFHVLNAFRKGIGPSDSNISIDDVLSYVQSVRSETGEGITRRQIKHALTRFEDENSIIIDGDTVSITKKGAEQTSLMDMMLDFLYSSEDHLSTPDTEIQSNGSLEIPARMTISQLSNHIQELEENYGGDSVLELRWPIESVNKAPKKMG